VDCSEGRAAAQGDGGGWLLLSDASAGPDMVGAGREDRGSYAALFRLEEGGLPVCWVNLAFSVAIAAAASGNIALIVDGSRPECLLVVEGVAGGRVNELRDPSTLSLFIASLRRLDMGSCA
jgi:hypothetical protein